MRGAVLLDVRGAAERRRDGISESPHVWLTFGPDDWRPPTSEERSEFAARVAQSGALRGKRLLVLCSVGLRSSAASLALASLGYDAPSIRDGWLGNSAGAGLRDMEAFSEAPPRTNRL